MNKFYLSFHLKFPCKTPIEKLTFNFSIEPDKHQISTLARGFNHIKNSFPKSTKSRFAVKFFDCLNTNCVQSQDIDSIQLQSFDGLIKCYKRPQYNSQHNFPRVLLFLTEKLFSLCEWEIMKAFSIVSSYSNAHIKHKTPQNMNEIIILTSFWTNEHLFVLQTHNTTPETEKFSFIFIFLFSPFFIPQRARQSTCIDPLSGKRIPFLEIFPEDLLCHASALSSLGLTLKFKYLVLHISAIAIFIWQTFFMHF